MIQSPQYLIIQGIVAGVLLYFSMLFNNSNKRVSMISGIIFGLIILIAGFGIKYGIRENPVENGVELIGTESQKVNVEIRRQKFGGPWRLYAYDISNPSKKFIGVKEYSEESLPWFYSLFKHRWGWKSLVTKDYDIKSLDDGTMYKVRLTTLLK